MTRERIAGLLARLRHSLWFIPTAMTLASAAAAVAMLSLDRRLGSGIRDVGFLFDAGSEGARGVLSTIAGSIITVTGVVFSVTIVALQLASSQFTPRVLRSFLEDRASQIVLGIFIATFTYSLLVLRAVRSSGEEIERFVPAISVTFAVALGLMSIGALIFFVNHIAHSMQVETILARVAQDVTKRVEELFPDEMGDAARDVPIGRPAWADPAGDPRAVRAESSGYLQHVEHDRLLALVQARDLVLKMECPIGAFVLEGDALALVWPGSEEEVDRAIAATFRLGSERTLFQDFQRGIIELTDIGVRALSPSVNDPTTAQAAIDRITQVLSLVGRRRFPDAIRAGDDGKPRVLAIVPDFEEIVRLPYGQLRHFGADQPAIAIGLVLSIQRVAQAVGLDRLRPLVKELEEVLLAAGMRIGSETDRERVLRIGEPLLEKLRLELRVGKG